MPRELLTQPGEARTAAASAQPWVVSWGAEPGPRGNVLARGRDTTFAIQGGTASHYTSTAVHGGLAVVVEGFVNGAEALRTALACSGVHATTAAEIVLHTYSRSGSRFLQQTRGVNARVVADLGRGTL